MRVVLRLRAAERHVETADVRTSGYPHRWSCWVVSLALHALALFAIVVASPGSSRSSRFEAENIQPKDFHKILLSPFPKRLPDVAPTKAIRKFRPPRGVELSSNTMIARAAKAPSRQQMIWQPVPKLKLPNDLAAPNMILSRATQLLLRPPTPMAKPPAKSPDPGISTERAAGPPEVAKVAPRKFVPPSRRVSRPKLPTMTSPLDAQAPALAVATAPTQPSLISRIGLSAPGVPPPPTKGAISDTEKNGDAKVDLAVVGLQPATSLKELPDGERAVRFSSAPDLGARSSGDSSKPGDVVVPNLTVVNEPKDLVNNETANIPSRDVLYSERLRGVTGGTFSVPLRPTSRTLPATIADRFQGRNVYTMVIPIENFPAYSGDWILWFAEKDPAGQEATSLRAPVPYRKREPIENPGRGGSHRMQIWGVIKRNGRLEILLIASKAGASAERALARDVLSWEFHSATRNNIPVDVEVVFEIPFNPPNTPAK